MMICPAYNRNARFKGELVELWQDKKVLLRMLLASFLIAANWLIYIYAVGHGQATQASLGYYIYAYCFYPVCPHFSS